MLCVVKRTEPGDRREEIFRVINLKAFPYGYRNFMQSMIPIDFAVFLRLGKLVVSLEAKENLPTDMPSPSQRN